MKTSWIVATAAALVLLPTLQAKAACHFTTETPILCTGAQTAALAFRRFGFDAPELSKPYVRDTLRASGCYVQHQAKTMGLKIVLMNAGRVPFADGYEPVDLIMVQNAGGQKSAAVYVSANTIAGTCEAFAPEMGGFAPPDHPEDAAYMEGYNARKQAAVEQFERDKAAQSHRIEQEQAQQQQQLQQH